MDMVKLRCPMCRKMFEISTVELEEALLIAFCISSAGGVGVGSSVTSGEDEGIASGGGCPVC